MIDFADNDNYNLTLDFITPLMPKIKEMAAELGVSLETATSAEKLARITAYLLDKTMLREINAFYAYLVSNGRNAEFRRALENEGFRKNLFLGYLETQELSPSTEILVICLKRF